MARKDLAITFKKHPLTKDITSLTGRGAVDIAIRNIVRTNFNERKRDPSFGTNTRAALFEIGSNLLAQSLKTDIETAIKQYEPSVGIVAITVVDDGDSELTITIIYTYATDPTESSTSVSLGI